MNKTTKCGKKLLRKSLKACSFEIQSFLGLSIFVWVVLNRTFPGGLYERLALVDEIAPFVSGGKLMYYIESTTYNKFLIFLIMCPEM
jgi:hypothetical protein